MAGMLSHDNIHKQQCDQLYFIGKATPVLMNHSSPKLKFKHIYDLKSEQAKPLYCCQKQQSAKDLPLKMSSCSLFEFLNSMPSAKL